MTVFELAGCGVGGGNGRLVGITRERPFGGMERGDRLARMFELTDQHPAETEQTVPSGVAKTAGAVSRRSSR